jgi:membrane-bound serine protease (ClpP class)
LVLVGSLLLLVWVGSIRGDDPRPGLGKQRPDSPQRPVLIRLDEDIDYRRAFFVRSKLFAARQLGADLILVEVDTPVGVKRECLELAQLLRDIDWAYTVAYVPNSASGGPFLVSLGADELIGSPESRIGDVGELSNESQLFAIRIAPEQGLSKFIQSARQLSEDNGRPADLVEAMIDRDVRVFQKTSPGGRVDFRIERHQADEAPRDIGDGWTLLVESEKDGRLVLSGERAAELGVLDALADSQQAVDQHLNVNVPYTEYRYSSVDEAAYWLNTPLITSVLIIVGLVALYIEISSPGVGLGGVIAGLCAFLFFWGRYLGGTSGILEVLIFSIGVVFLLMEVFVIPGWGISGLAGLILMVMSAVMAGQNFIVPTTEREWNTLLTSLVVLLGSSLIVMVIAAFITRRLGSIPIFNRLVLAGPAGDTTSLGKDKDDKAKPNHPTHPPVSVGDWGVSESVLRPAGRARFGRTLVYVVSDGSFVEKGVQVRVVQIEGSRIVVTEVEPQSERSS